MLVILESYVLHAESEDEYSIIMFGTSDNVNIIFACEYWMADGTFSLAPANYAQLFILMAKCNGIWCPYKLNSYSLLQ